jgi:hypothetical protein
MNTKEHDYLFSSGKYETYRDAEGLAQNVSKWMKNSAIADVAVVQIEIFVHFLDAAHPTEAISEDIKSLDRFRWHFSKFVKDCSKNKWATASGVKVKCSSNIFR